MLNPYTLNIQGSLKHAWYWFFEVIGNGNVKSIHITYVGLEPFLLDKGKHRRKTGRTIKYVLKRVSFGSKDCTEELKLECAYFLGQNS